MKWERYTEMREILGYEIHQMCVCPTVKITVTDISKWKFQWILNSHLEWSLTVDMNIHNTLTWQSSRVEYIIIYHCNVQKFELVNP